MNANVFLQRLAESTPSTLDRAIALVWFHSEFLKVQGPTIVDVCNAIEEAGYGQQNSHRIKSSLSKDRRVTKNAKGRYGIHSSAKTALQVEFHKYSGPPVLELKDGLLSAELFENARGYTVKVVAQLNISYESGLYDCCAVMCRRLLETLLIEAYEESNLDKRLKKPDGTFMALSGLIGVVNDRNELNLSRNGLKGLRDFKALGDLSAHNRRFNAIKSDIDKVCTGIRVASEELLYLSGQGKMEKPPNDLVA